jgi:hypothetical protein
MGEGEGGGGQNEDLLYPLLLISSRKGRRDYFSNMPLSKEITASCALPK